MKRDYVSNIKHFSFCWNISIFEEKKKINCRALCNKKRMY